MKINAINTLVHPKNFNSKQNNLKSPIKNSFTEYDKVCFTSLYDKNMPSKDFLNAVKNKKQRDDIIETIITDAKGNYKKENEELFLKTLDEAKYLLKDDDVFYEESCLPVLIEGTKIALSAIKDEKKDKFLDTINPVNVIAENAYLALMNGIDDVDEIFDVSKTANGKINLVKAQALIYLKSKSDVYLDCESALNFINRFCVTEGRLDYAKMNAVVNVMNISKSNQDSEMESVYELITDKKGNIDTEKYTFVSQAYDALISTACQDFQTDENHISKDNKDRIYYIIGNIMKNSKYKGTFDGNKAFDGLKSWLKYVNDSKDILNEKISLLANFKYPEGIKQQPISIAEFKSRGYEGWQTYDSSIFRLFALVCVQNTDIDTSKMN